ncbi:hypothetical protein [Streptomyces fuscichromogenes]|uniref:Uncharacterized protein n=1 Tax=Streptomyces fuscichromogenes TaxID=1324013 RepID=A0A917XAM1_9ACTN|nr:hypothetical protein [Streptomyces fuscichromogenes]GGN02403.1 hypothetical protein GCM10011578_024780 [Streptomyces fuscichromogenes]
MTSTGIGAEAGAQAARTRALAVLRIRGRALAVALLPAAATVILLTGGSTGHFVGRGWDTARWIVGVFAVLVLLAAVGVALVVARARPAVTPTVPIPEESAPDLYRMVRDLADRLDVPAPSAIALTPDCDSWLEDRTHPAHGPPAPRGGDELGTPGLHRRTPAAPVLVIGSPFLWWMRVGELRAVLAPVVAGTGPSAHPDIAAARRFVRGLDAAVAVSAVSGRCPATRLLCGGVGWVARVLLRGCREHAALMERGVAAAAAERAQAVDYGLRIVAQEQVGLAYAGWDRLLTRVALPAWRMGRWPSRLDAGVVAALTELSRRDRLAEGFASRLGERPACDLLEEPGLVDEAASLLAARLFHGGPAEPGPAWSPVAWQEYPEEVVDRTWRTEAARLHRVLDALGVRATLDPAAPDPGGPTLARVMDHLTDPSAPIRRPCLPTHDEDPHVRGYDGDSGGSGHDGDSRVRGYDGGSRSPGYDGDSGGPGDDGDPRVPGYDEDPHAPGYDADPRNSGHDADPRIPGYDEEGEETSGTERSAALAAGLTAALAREEHAEATGTVRPGCPAPAGQGTPGTPLRDEGALPLFPLQPPRTARELLAAHVTAMVCCAAVDTAGATPGLDWLDGPSLLVDGERAADLTPRVLSLIEEGDPAPLRAWLVESGIRPEKPVRLV